jgi:hypothetical protein
MSYDDQSAYDDQPGDGDQPAEGGDGGEPPAQPSEWEMQEILDEADRERGGEGNSVALAESSDAICADVCFYWQDRFWYRLRICDVGSIDNLAAYVEWIIQNMRRRGYPASAQLC